MTGHRSLRLCGDMQLKVVKSVVGNATHNNIYGPFRITNQALTTKREVSMLYRIMINDQVKKSAS